MRLDSATLDEARRFNRALHWAPRFKINNRVVPLVIQSLLQLSQFGGDGRLARAGIRVEQRMAQADGLCVPVRILRGARPPRAVVLDYHGGGWAIGNAKMNDQLNADLIAACDVMVVSVDYRLATNTPLAAIMDDCLAAARWLLDGDLADCACSRPPSAMKNADKRRSRRCTATCPACRLPSCLWESWTLCATTPC